MVKQILYPKDIIKPNYPVLFLAGPILGAPRWQAEALQYLADKDLPITAAVPIRYVPEGLERFGYPNITSERQRNWERHYLDLAYGAGAVVFWMPGQIEPVSGKGYGSTTRVELAVTHTRKLLGQDLSFFVGTDGNFQDYRISEFDLLTDCPDTPIYTDMYEMLDATVKAILQKNT